MRCGISLKKKSNKLWIWKAYSRNTGQLIDWECGGRDGATCQRLIDRLKPFKVIFFCTDHWEVYSNLLAPNKLLQGKDKTVAIERNNCQQRHWLARFKRKAIVGSKSLEMVNLSIQLFAAFRVNKNISLPCI